MGRCGGVAILCTPAQQRYLPKLPFKGPVDKCGKSGNCTSRSETHNARSLKSLAVQELVKLDLPQDFPSSCFDCGVFIPLTLINISAKGKRFWRCHFNTLKCMSLKCS